MVRSKLCLKPVLGAFECAVLGDSGVIDNNLIGNDIRFIRTL